MPSVNTKLDLIVIHGFEPQKRSGNINNFPEVKQVYFYFRLIFVQTSSISTTVSLIKSSTGTYEDAVRA